MNFLTIDVFLTLFIGMGPVKVLLLYTAATNRHSPIHTHPRSGEH